MRAFDSSGAGGGASCATLIASHPHTVRRAQFRADTIILMRRGTKMLSGRYGNFIMTAGTLLAARRGSFGDVANKPDAQGVYEALAIAFPEDLIREAARYATSPLARSGWTCIRPSPELIAAVDRLQAGATVVSISNRVRRLQALEVLELLRLCGIQFSPADLTMHERVWNLIATDPSHPWTLQFVADRCAVSTSTLRRRLMADGQTFSELLRETRLERGLNLLQSTSRPIGVICDEVGFRSASKFAAAFKARFGFPPSVLRSKTRESDQNLSATEQCDRRESATIVSTQLLKEPSR